jgi:hypothetical protein
MGISLLRRNTALDPPTVAPAEVARILALDAVDAALQQVRGRRRLIRSEASGILRDLRARVESIVLGTETLRALDDALVSLGTDAVVDGRRVVDALLDVRLAAAHPRPERR